mgnify:CR=1 FL=1
MIDSATRLGHRLLPQFVALALILSGTAAAQSISGTITGRVKGGFTVEIDNVRAGVVLDEMHYHRFSVKYSTLFEAKIGAEAIYDIFRQMDLPALKEKLETKYPTAAAAEREKLAKRIALISNMIGAVTVIPLLVRVLKPKFITAEHIDDSETVRDRNSGSTWGVATKIASAIQAVSRSTRLRVKPHSATAVIAPKAFT